MGGKNSSSNDSVVNEQKAEAADAARKEAERQARLKKGLASIKTAFEGTPVMKSTSTPYDWSTFKPAVNPAGSTADTLYSGAPAGYTVVRTAAKPKAASTTGTGAAAKSAVNPYTGASTGTSPYQTVTQNSGGRGGATDSGAYSPNAGGGSGRGPIPQATSLSSGGGGSSGDVYALKGPDGKIYYQGDPLSLTTQTATGETTGGFDDAFYNKYKQSVLDYYMPQVADQYKKATDQATYALGRSGNLRSSAANSLVADLAKQNATNEAGIRSQADTATGDLKNQVASERQKATSQLYATEDPEVAAQQALDAVRNISLEQPSLSPLSALFNVATVGGANIAKGYQSQQALNTFTGALPENSSRVVRTG